MASVQCSGRIVVVEPVAVAVVEVVDVLKRSNSWSRTKCTAALVELTVVVKLVAVAVVELQTDRMTRLK